MLVSSDVTHISVELPLSQSVKDALKAEGLAIPESLKSAHPGRQEKFLAGRYCALLALRRAGANIEHELGIRPDGSPDWPSHWIGSITHHEKMAGAAVGHAASFKGIGLDYEIVMTQKTFENVAQKILVGYELTTLKPASWTEREWVTLVFSAKESIYKCLRPLCGEFFGFEAAELTSFDEKGFFTFQLTKDIGGEFKAGWTGRGQFEKKEDQLFTAIEYR